MSTLLQDGVDWFVGQMKNSAGRTVTFVRGTAIESDEFTAWVTTEKHRVMDTHGIPVLIRTRSYKFETTDLSYIPRKGDAIRETIGSKAYDFEVLPTPDEPETAWVDHDGKITIVRCKEVRIS